MIFPQVSVEEWTARYHLEALSWPCLSCGKMRHANIPFAHGNWRGLRSVDCSCGKGSPLVLGKDLGHEDEWKEIFKHASSFPSVL